jgi:hypothetical protein
VTTCHGRLDLAAVTKMDDNLVGLLYPVNGCHGVEYWRNQLVTLRLEVVMTSLGLAPASQLIHKISRRQAVPGTGTRTWPSQAGRRRPRS